MSNTTRCEIAFRADHPALAGHFPNNPLLPAALLLERIVLQWQRSTDSASATPQLQQLRFSQPALPELPIALQWQPRDEHSWRVSARQCEREIFRGQIAQREPDLIELAAGVAEAPRSAGDCYQLLPHAGSMCLIEQFAASGDHSLGSAVLAPDNPLLTQRHFSPWLALEYAAQLFACCGARQLGQLQRAQVALVRRLSAHAPAVLACGQRIDVRLSLTERQRDACSCVFQLTVAGQLFASGEFTAVFG